MRDPLTLSSTTRLVLLATLTLAACGPSRRERTIAGLTPAAMHSASMGRAPSASPDGRPPARFRIYVDPRWQAQKGDWRRAAEAIVSDAAATARLELGTSFVIDHLAPWPDPPGGDALEPWLTALAALDPGDVDVWVVGFVGGRPVTSSTFEHIGLAHIPGRHFVMRSMADLDEADAIGRLHVLDDADRRRLLRARMKHRRAVVFLHEWGHTLGAVHARDTEVIMAEGYNDRIRGFGAPALGVGFAALATLTETPTDAESAVDWFDAQRRAAIDWYLAHPDARVVNSERARLIDSNQAVVAATGDTDRDPPDAVRTAEEAHAAMEAGRVTAVERFAARTPPETQAEIAEWATLTRRRFAMPAGFPSTDEAAYVAAQREVDAALAQDRLDVAEEAIGALRDRWPDAAAGPQLACDLAGRRGQFTDAVAHCRRAIDRDPETIGAWLMIAMIALHQQRPVDAIEPLERVVELDPLQTSAWLNLALIYEQLDRADDREALVRRYVERVGRPFPEAQP